MHHDLTIPCWEDEAADWRTWQKELNAALQLVHSDFFGRSEATKPHHAGLTLLQALYLANDGGTFPLARFIRDPEGRALLSDQEWRWLAVALTTLQQPLKLKQGRPYGKGNRVSKARAAERHAARLLAASLDQWRLKHGRKRVRWPSALFESRDIKDMIAQAIKEAAHVVGVPQHQVCEDNIRSLLKTGRII